MINDNIYNINYDRLVVWSLPIKWRIQLNVIWLNTLIKPLKSIYELFLIFRIKSNYKLMHNSQVASIEDVLNDLFDSNLRRIVIRNSEVKEPVWFYEPEENKPVLFYNEADNKPVYFYEQSDLSQVYADFTVVIPISLKPSNSIALAQFEIEVKREVDYYKLYSKNYDIRYE